MAHRALSAVNKGISIEFVQNWCLGNPVGLDNPGPNTASFVVRHKKLPTEL